MNYLILLRLIRTFNLDPLSIPCSLSLFSVLVPLLFSVRPSDYLSCLSLVLSSLLNLSPSQKLGGKGGGP